MTRRDDLEAVQVYVDKQCVGAIAERMPGRWRAIDKSGRTVGEFNTMLAASRAVRAAHRAEEESAT